MALTRDLDWRTVGLAAVLILAVLQPPVQIVNALKEGDRPAQESYLWVVGALAIFVAFPLGGWFAARRQPRTPFLHSAVASAIGFLAVVVIRTVVRLATGEGTGFSLITDLLLAQIAVSLGVLGGYVAYRQRLSRGQRAEETAT